MYCDYFSFGHCERACQWLDDLCVFRKVPAGVLGSAFVKGSSQV